MESLSKGYSFEKITTTIDERNINLARVLSSREKFAAERVFLAEQGYLGVVGSYQSPERAAFAAKVQREEFIQTIKTLAEAIDQNATAEIAALIFKKCAPNAATYEAFINNPSAVGNYENLKKVLIANKIIKNLEKPLDRQTALNEIGKHIRMLSEQLTTTHDKIAYIFTKTKNGNFVIQRTDHFQENKRSGIFFDTKTHRIIESAAIPNEVVSAFLSQMRDKSSHWPTDGTYSL